MNLSTKINKEGSIGLGKDYFQIHLTNIKTSGMVKIIIFGRFIKIDGKTRRKILS